MQSEQTVAPHHIIAPVEGASGGGGGFARLRKRGSTASKTASKPTLIVAAPLQGGSEKRRRLLQRCRSSSEEEGSSSGDSYSCGGQSSNRKSGSGRGRNIMGSDVNNGDRESTRRANAIEGKAVIKPGDTNVRVGVINVKRQVRVKKGDEELGKIVDDEVKACGVGNAKAGSSALMERSINNGRSRSSGRRGG